MNGQNNPQLTPGQLLEQYFNLDVQAENLERQVKKCEAEKLQIKDIVGARQVEAGAVTRLLQKQAEDKKAEEEAKAKAKAEEDKKKAEAEAKEIAESEKTEYVTITINDYKHALPTSKRLSYGEIIALASNILPEKRNDFNFSISYQRAGSTETVKVEEQHMVEVTEGMIFEVSV